jgi:hypothetical protein
MSAVAGCAASPLDAIDAALAERLLAAALSSGGDYADLYFEHRSGADYVLEDGRIRTVGRGVTLGLGVRVLRGDATGYAYTEELDEARMTEAARTAAQIAASGAVPGPIAVRPVPLADRYRVTEPSLARPGVDKVALLRRPTPPHAPTIRASSASRRRWPRNGGGPGGHVRRPPGARSAADDPLRRVGGRRGRAAAARWPLRRRGRFGMEFFARPARAPRNTAAKRRAWRSDVARRRGARGPDGGRAGRGRIRDPAARGGGATAWRPTSTASARRITPTRSASRSRRRCAR